MRVEPPAELVELLERLRLVTAEQLRGVYPRVKQLAGDLPLFPSVWVDALAHARVISPFQAAEINAGRSERLRVGPFVITAPLLSLGYADCFRALEVESQRPVHLLVATAPPVRCIECSRKLSELIARLGTAAEAQIQHAVGTGADGDLLWVAYAPIEARTARDLVQQSGRLPGDAVLELARQMALAMARLEDAGIVHGDMSVSAIWTGSRGLIQLAHCGVRGILRSEEALAEADRSPEMFDYLAPERAAGAPASTRSDLFACGAVWWHLLTGRPPLSGGTSLGKLRAAQAGRIVDVRRYAPDAPAPLLAAIAACIQHDPRQRPESFAALVTKLGAPTPAGRRALAQSAAASGGGQHKLARTTRRAIRSQQTPAWIATIAGCLAVVAVVASPLWRRHLAAPAAHGITRDGEPKTLANRDRDAKPSAGDKSVPADAVERATYLDSAAEPRANRMSRNLADSAVPANGPPPITLPSGSLTIWNPAENVLQAGQTVRGRPGERPLIAVPPSGIVVAVEDVNFENVDFVWRRSEDAAIDPERLALIDLRAARASFQGCTFQAAPSDRVGRPTAICWNGAKRQGPLPPAGRLQLNRCALSGVATGIDCRLATPLALKISNTLYLGPGPLLRLDRAPRTDEPIEIELTHSTLRDAAALVGLHVERLPTDEPGTIGITTNDCALAPSRGGAIVLIAAPLSPTTLAKAFQVSGQGSLLSSQGRVGTWLKPGNASRGAELEIPVDGLVSGDVEFAGPADAGSSASRVTRWLAPVQSVEPPGIPDGLPNLPSLGQIER